ncbi:MAG: glycoside hydrolase family 78 protein [Chitinophagaceae bacterium]|nr:glycoside hydrolase family 78 protein [Chitinophagaceae bacterium]
MIFIKFWQKSLCVFVILILIGGFAKAQLQVSSLLVDNKTNPVGVSETNPELTWIIQSNERNTVQTAYEIKVSASPKLNDLLWSSGKVSSDQSVHVPYNGKPLASAKKYFWQVRVWDNHGKTSAWSAVNEWQMALLNKSDWQAKWIETADAASQSIPMFRKEFNTNKKIQSATLFITAYGMYEAKINGKKVGDAFLTPGWTVYGKRLQYQQYDVTAMLKSGNNAIGVTVGNGWYRSHMAWNNDYVKGKTLGLLCQLQIEYADGSNATVLSDGSWKSSTGEIRYSEVYNGETIDASLAKGAWAESGYNDKDWSSVQLASYGYDNLISTENELVKKHEIFKPVKIFTTPKGETVIDFGQNLVGWEVVKVSGNKGDTITINHAEVLDKEGNFYTTNLRAAKSENKYVLKGGGEETFEPHFTWHGFRYIQVRGYKGNLNPDNFTAVALYSAMPQTGSFTTSNALINQLQHNIEWGQKGNFLDVPTDCPQRDERLGWTGDAQAFSRTATFNMGVNSFFDKWMKDVATDQAAMDGSVPFVVPNVLGKNAGGSAGWADAATIIPWNIYLAYGDKKILENQYPSMKAWVEYMKSKSKDNLWNTGFHFGDWLFYRPDDDNDGRSAVTDKYLITQCFYAHSTQLLINAAQVLGKSEDVATYSQLLSQIKDAFVKEYMTSSGRLVSSTQTAYVLALNFDMLPENLRAQAAKRLVDNVESYNHITTGFLGTPYICEVLTRFGYADIAYKLLFRKIYPSWLYPVTMGATTIWERWDGMKPDSTFQTPGMNSFNHYAYGAIGDYMYRQVVGLDTYEDGVGYKHIKVQPHIGKGFSYAKAALQTYYGEASGSWKIDGSALTMDIVVPANTKASIFIPGGNANDIKENGKSIGNISELKVIGNRHGYTELEAGSGTYHFEAPYSN